MKEQVLSIEQMQELQKLDIDTSKASMFWHPAFYRINGILDYERYEDIPRIKLENNYNLEYDIPIFILQDILEMIPRAWEIGAYNANRNTITVFLDNETGHCHQEVSDSLLEAAFNMLKWCKQNNLI